MAHTQDTRTQDQGAGDMHRIKPVELTNDDTFRGENFI